MKRNIALILFTVMLGFGVINPNEACQATHRCSGGETISCTGTRRCSSGPGYVNCYDRDGGFSSSSCPVA